MKRIAISLGLVLAGLLAGIWWTLLSEPPSEPRVVAPGRPLPMDEEVRLRFVDEETGEEEHWTVRKRETGPEERSGRPLPEPDPNAGRHRPDESSRTLSGMALESWKRGEVRRAMEQFEQAIEVDPDDPLPRTQYGRLLLHAMAYNDSLPQLERAAELRPDDPQIWLDLASLHEKTLQLDRSWAAKRRAEELADGREIRREEAGFWVIGDTSIYP